MFRILAAVLSLRSYPNSFLVLNNPSEPFPHLCVYGLQLGWLFSRL